jgi:[FeFe] hydrogenase H-cluster maturation GTPase HydF
MTDTAETPLAELTHIVLAGVRNAGKSSLMNNLFRQNVAIVSPTAGTTTDPVTRKIELGKLGMCSVTDTAGLDDSGQLGGLRIEKTKTRLESADLVLFVTPGIKDPEKDERQLLDLLQEKKIPYIGVITYADRPVTDSKQTFFPKDRFVLLDNTSDTVKSDKAAGTVPEGLKPLFAKIESMSDSLTRELTPVEGLVHEGDLVLLVTPIDLAAPAGRLILPQVETIRDLLDHDCPALIVKERELYETYHSLGRRPALVITDSQAFSKVAADIPEDQPLTSFSILFARKKGDMNFFIESLKILSRFPPHGRVLVMEGCSHHRQADDLGSVKIPRLFHQLVSSKAEFSFTKTIPGDIQNYDLVIHCAACMLTQRAMCAKLAGFKSHGIPVINYGLFLAWANGLLPRALEPIPGLADLYEAK